MTEAYHHRDLKECLLKNGLKLLNEVGLEEFSLRKVAKMCDVSHTAPYRHFKNKEELITAIHRYVGERFEECLREAAEANDQLDKRIVEIGKAYVNFMIENPDYLKFLFITEKQCDVSITNQTFETSDGAFRVFQENAVLFFENIGIPKEEHLLNIVAMWSMVHGIATLISSGSLSFNGDLMTLVESLLVEKLRIKNYEI